MSTIGGICDECGKPVLSKVRHGICPECLMRAGLGGEPEMAGCTVAASPSARFVPPTPSELAEHFPQLEILEMIGCGGMGAVYKARQKQLNRQVALKILPIEMDGDRGFAERFTREARALAQLNHPNIIGVYDFGRTGGYYDFVMEFMDGINLRQLLQESRPAPDQAMDIVAQVCEALQYAHDNGVVHRDIKPENILLDQSARVKIADFGLAKLMAFDPEEQRLTRSRDVMGTPHYMAPEQLEKPMEVDHRADIYSMGVVFYELLTGELPLGKFDPPSHKAQTDVRLDEIISRVLQKNPERRFQHASEVKTAMESVVTTVIPRTSSGATDLAQESCGEESHPSPLEKKEAQAGKAKPIGIAVGLISAIVVIGIAGQVFDLWNQAGSQKQTISSKLRPAALFQGIPPRDPEADPKLIDLNEYYNAVIGDNWHDPVTPDNHLGELPTGLQTMAGTLFDIRGLVQVMANPGKYPPKVEGIPVGQSCKQLHFLHAAINAPLVEKELEIGRYTVYYANGERRDIPLVVGRNLADWYEQPFEAEPAFTIAWTGNNPKSIREGRRIRLFKDTWNNPLPEVPIKTIDLMALHYGPSPFLVAITAE